MILHGNSENDATITLLNEMNCKYGIDYHTSHLPGNDLRLCGTGTTLQLIRLNVSLFTTQKMCL